MGDPVNPARRYRSDRRSAQAAETRQAVLVAARELFVADGWQKTTIAAIARKARVSPETIYAVFGNKRAVLDALLTSAVRGSAPETPLLDQATPRAIAAETSQQRQIAIFARDIAAVLSRMAPLMAVVRSAGEADPQLAELYRNLHAGRRRNLQFLIEALVANGPLRQATIAEATSQLWRLVSPELFLLMRDQEGMESEAYADWLADTLAVTLLP